MSRDRVFKVSCEAMRVTVRITQIIAWVMLQKAILDGELSREDIFSDKSPILQGEPCLDSSTENDPQLPPRLRELLSISRTPCLRTMRLEQSSLKVHPRPEEIKKGAVKGCYAVPSAVNRE